MFSSFTIPITSFDDLHSLRLPKIVFDGNGVYIVFYEEKDSILEPGYGGRRDKWGTESYSVVPARSNLSE
jgi:hypothetical protein